MSQKFERHAATVTRANTEARDGSIFIKCPTLLGDNETEFPDPVLPAFDWGWFYVPDVGEEVEIEVQVADSFKRDVEEEFWLASGKIVWRGVRYQSTDGEAPRPPHPELTAAQTYGKRRGFSTPSGHLLLFDDTPGAESVSLTAAQAETTSTVTMFANGNVEIRASNGSTAVTVQADGTVNINGGTVNINAGGDADQAILRGTEFNTWLSQFMLWVASHVHSAAGVGPPAAPPPPVPPTILSLAAKVR